jgi:NAD+ diphosphatase
LRRPNTFAGGRSIARARSRDDALAGSAAWPTPRRAWSACERGGRLVEGDRPRRSPVDGLPEETRRRAARRRTATVTRSSPADPGDAFPGERRGLRDLAPVLSQAQGGMVAHAVGLLNWHRRHRFCANCGAPTAAREAGTCACARLWARSTIRAPTQW